MTDIKFPRFLYRCFDEEDHAMALINGQVWVSTFQWLRDTDRLRGDTDEATAELTVTNVDTDNPSPDTQQTLDTLRSFGFDVGPGGKVFINAAGISFRHRPNGYLICTTAASPTDAMRRLFGNHCVRIANPQAFIEAVSAHFPDGGRADYLDYSGRKYKQGSQIPTDTAFLGDPRNAHEREFRIYMNPRPNGFHVPFLLPVPEVARLCSMI